MTELQAEQLLHMLRRRYGGREFCVSELAIDEATARWLAEQMATSCVYWPGDDNVPGYYRFNAYLNLPVEPDIAVARIAQLLDDPGAKPIIIHSNRGASDEEVTAPSTG